MKYFDPDDCELYKSISYENMNEWLSIPLNPFDRNGKCRLIPFQEKFLSKINRECNVNFQLMSIPLDEYLSKFNLEDRISYARLKSIFIAKRSKVDVMADIWSYDDEWFLIKIFLGDLIFRKFYLCDGVDGVIKYIDDIIQFYIKHLNE